jgi:hypothetical protein
MPFFLKDGLLAMIGGHSVGIVYGTVALAFAVYGQRSGRARWWPLAAGLIWAVGCWYIRTTYVVFPALVLALVPLGRGGLLRFGLGTLLLPCLLWANASILVDQVQRYEQVEVASLTLELALRLDHSEDSTEVYPNSQLSEATGWLFRDFLFAQPEAGDQQLHSLPGAAALGVLWVVAWLASIPLFLLAMKLDLGQDGRDPQDARASGGWTALRAALLMLPLSYIAAYLITPERIELAAVHQALTTFATSPAPEVNPVRYLIPIGLAWTVLLSCGLAAAWGARQLRWLAAAILLVTAGGGWVLAAGDLLFQRSSGDFSSMRASNYRSISLPGRLPPIAVHLRALNSDPESRQYRFWALGQLALPSPGAEQVGGRRSLVEWSSAALRPLTMDGQDRIWFYEGFGGAVANHLFGQPTGGQAETIDRIGEMASSLSEPSERLAFLTGVVAALPDPTDPGFEAFGLEDWEEDPAASFRAVWRTLFSASPEHSGHEEEGEQP